MAGRLPEAAAAWRNVLQVDAANGQALLFLGQHALQNKDFAVARQFLEKAAVAAPGDPVIPLNLSFLFRATGDHDAEKQSLSRALDIDPYCYPALLSMGMLLERTGRSRKAAQVFKNALACSPPEQQLSPQMQQAIVHARAAVDKNARQLDGHLETRLQRLREQSSGESLNRFEETKAIALGRRKPYTQEPSMLLIPRMPAIPFYDDAQFDWLKDIEAMAPAIREEFLQIFREDNNGFTPYVNHPNGAPVEQWKELNRSLRWSAFFLWKDGKRMEDNCARSPKAVEAVERVPTLNIPNFGPTVMFSVLSPHTHIPAHSSVTNARLVVHLPIIVPPNCYFRVGNEKRQWKEGKAWVFDDTINHEAWNDSDELRVILMIDIWNPLLANVERALISELLNGMRDYYES